MTGTQYAGTLAETNAELTALEGASNVAKFNGTGSQTVFNIPHTLGAVPVELSVTAGSAAAAAPFYVTATSTNLVVTFLTAPATGTNNVLLNWSANVANF